eukprot:gene4176-4732_t
MVLEKSDGDNKSARLQVAVRVRPINDAEIENGCTDIAHVIDRENMVVLMDPCDDPDDILRVNDREKSNMYLTLHSARLPH